MRRAARRRLCRCWHRRRGRRRCLTRRASTLSTRVASNSRARSHSSVRLKVCESSTHLRDWGLPRVLINSFVWWQSVVTATRAAAARARPRRCSTTTCRSRWRTSRARNTRALAGRCICDSQTKRKSPDKGKYSIQQQQSNMSRHDHS